MDGPWALLLAASGLSSSTSALDRSAVEQRPVVSARIAVASSPLLSAAPGGLGFATRKPWAATQELRRRIGRMLRARCNEVKRMRETPSRLSSPERRGSYLHLVVWGSPRENPGQRPEDAEDPQVVWSDVSG